MKKDPIKVIPLEQIQLNEGQIDWLPRNPRTWTQTDIDRTKRSLDEDPDFMQERPILAVPGPEKNTFVAFCGNLRLTAARALGWPGAPVVVYRPEGISKEDRDTIIRRAIKDNGSFGSWDTDELASLDVENWELEDWGVPEWITGGARKETVSTGSGEGGDTPGETKVKKPTLQALITFPDADALADFAAKYAPEIIEQYDAEIIY